MKKIKWMDVVIASPMVLTFASAGGVQAILSSAAILAIAASLLRWGRHVKIKTVERKVMTSPFTVSQRF